MSCPKVAICPYVKGKTQPPVAPAVIQSDQRRYCEGTPASCALYQAMDKIGFLKLPKDLRPIEVGRVAGLSR